MSLGWLHPDASSLWSRPRWMRRAVRCKVSTNPGSQRSSPKREVNGRSWASRTHLSRTSCDDRETQPEGPSSEGSSVASGSGRRGSAQVGNDPIDLYEQRCIAQPLALELVELGWFVVVIQRQLRPLRCTLHTVGASFVNVRHRLDQVGVRS